MSFPGASASVYTDFAGLSELRLKAQQHSPEALEGVAAEFEALFLQMMLKSMRASTPGDSLLGSDAESLYLDLFDRQISLEMAGSKGVGLASLLADQLRASIDETSAAVRTIRRSDAATALPPQPANVLRPPHGAATAVATPYEEVDIGGSQEDFVHALWPHAERVAGRLGVDPAVLIAQAALETGWGKSVIRNPDGTSSHNVFAIKADARWSGKRAVVSTVEFVDGVMVRENAPFRSYESFAQGFDDYAEFVSAQPRYQRAIAHAGDAEAYMRALHDAGYASDPDYADKVLTILRQNALPSLK